MRKRAARVEETRRRIVEATLALHNEHGIGATSWDEIARQAGVGVGTVYRHFRSLDELVPACGVVTWELLGLPDEEGARAIFAGVEGAPARLRRLVEELFAVYERGAPAIENVRRERRALPHLLEEHHRELEAAFDRLVAEALAPLAAGIRREAVRAITDLQVWRSLRERGFSAEEAVELATRAALGAVAPA